ncbi:MAG: hypothetical protein GTO14_23870 [Anaerolineales bacterium]|nr:hypothetical protein [Anaerolineales bacterium]
MKKFQMITIFLVLLIFTSSCGPSKAEIATANAQTQSVMDRSATDVAETQEAKTETESAMRTSNASSTSHAATATKAVQETATREAEQTSAVESTIVAATLSASSMHGQVMEFVNSGILSHADGVYYSLSLDFDSLSGDEEVFRLETGFMPTDFVLRFDFSCPHAIENDLSVHGIEFRGSNGNAYVVNIRLGMIDIVRFLEADAARLEKILDEIDDNWQPGDEPVIIDFSPWLASGALPEGVKEFQVTLAVDDALFYIFVDGEKLFRAYDTNLKSGHLRFLRGSIDSDCQMKNIELWILN